MSELVPTHGVRVLLDRIAIEGTRARYRVEIHAPESSWASEAALDTSVLLEPWQPIRGSAVEPEPWMIESARGLLRTLIKNHATDGAYPHRLLRWRQRH